MKMRATRPSRNKGMSMKNLKDKIGGVVFGTAIGDAVGYPLEFVAQAERKLTDPLTYPRLTKGVALYSDDTQMTVAVLEGLLRSKSHGNFDRASEEVAEELVAWSNSPDNNRAPGGACMAGCRRLEEGLDWRLTGGPDALGSGAAMRSQAYALWWHRCGDEAGRWAALHAQMTHRHPAALEASYLTAVATQALMMDLEGDELENYIFEGAGHYDPETEDLVYGAFTAAAHGVQPTEALLEDFPGQRSDHAIAAALICYLRSEGSFDKAVRLGVLNCKDADTVGCLAGALWGARYGLSRIRTTLIQKIENRNLLNNLVSRVTKAVTVEV